MRHPGVALRIWPRFVRTLVAVAIAVFLAAAFAVAPAGADQSAFGQAVEGASGLAAYFPLSADYADAVSGGPTLGGEGPNLATTGGPWLGSGALVLAVTAMRSCRAIRW